MTSPLAPQRPQRSPFRTAATLLLVAVAGLTCDAGQALAPAGAEPVVLAYAGPPTIALGDTIALAVIAERGGVSLESPRLLVTSSDTSVLAVRAGGDSLVARRRGTAMLSVRLLSAILPDGGDVVSQPIRVVVAALVVDPQARDFTSLGDTVTLRATATDANGLVVEVPVAWRSTDAQVAAVDARGRVSAVASGTTLIEARVAEDEITATATVRVRQAVSQLVFAPASIRMDALQLDTAFAVEGRDANGNTVPDISPTLASCNPSIASLTTSGTLRSVANGSTCVVARLDDATDTLAVVVDQQAVRVAITPLEGTIIRAPGGTLEFVAVGYDRAEVPIGDTPPTWYPHPDDAAVARVADPSVGLVEGLAKGFARIVARTDTATATVVVEIRNDPDSVAVEPADTTITSVGDAASFRALVFNERDALIADATPAWSSLDPGVATVDTAGVVASLAEGTARIVATAGSRSGTGLVRVQNVPVSLALASEADTLSWLGFEKTLSVEARNARGDLLDPATLDWSSDDAAIASVSGEGTVTARAVGETWVRVRARIGTLEDATRIVVTNEPMALTLNAELDTLTALGQSLQYIATVRNGAGDALSVPVTWTTTEPLVTSVDGAGVATAMGYGSSRVVATAGEAADTVDVVVRNTTRLYVDNGVVTTVRVGTLKRPYLRIGDGVAAADAFDTVLVRPGAGAYAEHVVIARRITLLGDSSAFVSSGRDSLRLPVLAHDVDTAGLVASGVPVTIRYLAIRHSLDGPAIATRGGDVDLEWVYVNPGRDAFATGRGIVVADVPTVARMRRVWVGDVRGAGIRLVNVSGGDLADIGVQGVRAAPDATGAGIEVSGGSGTTIARARVRATAGPQMLVDGAAATTLVAPDLAGEAQLLAVRNAAGPTLIDAPLFDLRPQTGDVFTGNSETDGRAGLEVRASGAVTLRDGRFVDASGATSKMDAVRLVDARGGSSGAAYGLRLERTTFAGGRHVLRSERSTLEMVASRVDGAPRLPLVLADADTARLSNDTLSTGIDGCIRGTGSEVAIAGSLLDRCGGLATPAIDLSGGGGLDMTTSSIRGGSGRAIALAGARRARLRSVSVRSAGGSTSGATGRAVLELAANEITVAHVTVDGFAAHTAIDVDGLLVRVDSNVVTRNLGGLRFAQRPGSPPTGNDLWENGTGARNDDPLLSIDAPDNWWGDARGPEGSGDPDAVGDPVVGAFALSPLRAGPRQAGTTTAALRMIRGDGQVGTPNVPLPQRLSVRVVDAAGAPVAGAAVRFEVLQGGKAVFENGTSTITPTSNASGLAEAQMTITRSGEQIGVRVTAFGSANTLTFIASTP